MRYLHASLFAKQAITCIAQENKFRVHSCDGLCPELSDLTEVADDYCSLVSRPRLRSESLTESPELTDIPETDDLGLTR